MSQINRTTFDTTYANSSGTFADNTTRLISEGDLRQFSDDINESFVNQLTDINFNPTGTQQTGYDFIVPSVGVTGSYIKIGSILSSDILTSNSAPVELVSAPGSGLVIMPISFFFFLDYNSAAYATNTTFNVLLHTTFVSIDNTTMLSGTADRYRTMYPIEFDTTTNMSNRSLYFKTQTGNPTAGNSPIYYSVIYRVVPTLFLP